MASCGTSRIIQKLISGIKKKNDHTIQIFFSCNSEIKSRNYLFLYFLIHGGNKQTNKQKVFREKNLNLEIQMQNSEEKIIELRDINTEYQKIVRIERYKSRFLRKKITIFSLQLATLTPQFYEKKSEFLCFNPWRKQTNKKNSEKN